MSTQNILDISDEVVEEVLDNCLQELSMGVIRNIRFAYGKLDHEEIRHILRLRSIFSRRRSLSKEQNKKLKEEIFTKTHSEADGLYR